MSLSPKIYSSTDPGAPQISGQGGSFTAFLDAILVNGYGSGSDAKSGLGWSIELAAGNKRVYRNSALLGSGKYLRVDDTGSIGTARHAWLRSFENMTDVDSGEGPNPTLTDEPNGSLWPKSSTLDGVARPWWVVGNAVAFYLFAAVSSNDIEVSSPQFAGDIKSRISGDTNNFFISSSGRTTWDGNAAWEVSRLFRAEVALSTGTISAREMAGYVGRAYTAVPGAVRVGHTQDDIYSRSSNVAFGGSGTPYPDPVGAGLLLRHATIREGAGHLRGFMPGLFIPFHVRPFADKQVIANIEDLGGSTLIAKNFRTMQLSNAVYSGQVLFLLGEEW